jgi:hypothetical protein
MAWAIWVAAPPSSQPSQLLVTKQSNTCPPNLLIPIREHASLGQPFVAWLHAQEVLSCLTIPRLIDFS